MRIYNAHSGKLHQMLTDLTDPLLAALPVNCNEVFVDNPRHTKCESTLPCMFKSVNIRQSYKQERDCLVHC